MPEKTIPVEFTKEELRIVNALLAFNDAALVLPIHEDQRDVLRKLSEKVALVNLDNK